MLNQIDEWSILKSPIPFQNCFRFRAELCVSEFLETERVCLKSLCTANNSAWLSFPIRSAQSLLRMYNLLMLFGMEAEGIGSACGGWVSSLGGGLRVNTWCAPVAPSPPIHAQAQERHKQEEKYQLYIKEGFREHVAPTTTILKSAILCTLFKSTEAKCDQSGTRTHKREFP
jgi:hypothetical protein